MAWYADSLEHYYRGKLDSAESGAREELRLDSAERNLRACTPDLGQVEAQLSEIESFR